MGIGYWDGSIWKFRVERMVFMVSIGVISCPRREVMARSSNSAAILKSFLSVIGVPASPFESSQFWTIWVEYGFPARAVKIRQGILLERKRRSRSTMG